MLRPRKSGRLWRFLRYVVLRRVTQNCDTQAAMFVDGTSLVPHPRRDKLLHAKTPGLRKGIEAEFDLTVKLLAS